VPAVHRDRDNRTCKAKTNVTGQSTVFVNGQLVSVQGDPNTHIKGELLADVGSGTLFVNGKLVVLDGSGAKPDRRRHRFPADPKADGGSPDVFGG